MTSGADIQVEDGNWSKVHNEIWKSLARAPLSGAEFRCLMYLFRMTYGWRRKAYPISMAEFADNTGLQRRSVIRVLQGLITKGIVKQSDNGPRTPATWSFNKYTEKWNFGNASDEMVTIDSPPSDQDVTIYSDDLDTTASDQDDTKTHLLKDSKDKKESSLLAADSDDTIALVRLAYEAVCKIGPPMRDEVGRSNLIVAATLIDRFGYPACVRYISTLKDRYNATLGRARHGISAPLPYLRSIMEDELGNLSPIVSVPATVDFALEDITQ